MLYPQNKNTHTYLYMEHSEDKKNDFFKLTIGSRK